MCLTLLGVNEKLYPEPNVGHLYYCKGKKEGKARRGEMMDDRTLERVSESYARGYHHGYDGLEKQYSVDPETLRPFGKFDYDKGYEHGANDAKWTRIYAERNAQ
jgi:hypothetical protein